MTDQASDSPASGNLPPCPFCGRAVDLEDMDTLYPSGIGWEFDTALQLRIYHTYRDVPKEQWCWSMHCPESAGGCGAEVPGDSREEALTKWCARAGTSPDRVSVTKDRQDK